LLRKLGDAVRAWCLQPGPVVQPGGESAGRFDLSKSRSASDRGWYRGWSEPDRDYSASIFGRATREYLAGSDERRNAHDVNAAASGLMLLPQG
jgi:hypothetical protein